MFVRLVPFELAIDNITCVINDGSETNCEKILGSPDLIGECVHDLKFNYTFIKVGLSCVEIMDLSATLGPIGENLLDFGTIYSYQER